MIGSDPGMFSPLYNSCEKHVRSVQGLIWFPVCLISLSTMECTFLLMLASFFLHSEWFSPSLLNWVLAIGWCHKAEAGSTCWSWKRAWLLQQTWQPSRTYLKGACLSKHKRQILALRCLKFEGMWQEFWPRWRRKQHCHPKVRTFWGDPGSQLSSPPSSGDRFWGERGTVAAAGTVQNYPELFLSWKVYHFGPELYFFSGKTCRNYFQFLQKMSGTISFCATILCPRCPSILPCPRMAGRPQKPEVPRSWQGWNEAL